MPTSAVLTPPAVFTALSEQPREVFVEFRAATVGEVTALDFSADQVVLPAYVLMNREQWRAAVSPFPIEPRGRLERPWRAPGSLIWAQMASRLGDRIVGGRDRSGLPSFPVPTENGSIRFIAAVPGGAGYGATDRETAQVPGPQAPSIPVEFRPDELSECEPVLSPDGPIVCSSPGCDGCLQALTRTSWNTTIACFCNG